MNRPNAAKLPDKEGIYWIKLASSEDRWKTIIYEYTVGKVYDNGFFIIGDDELMPWDYDGLDVSLVVIEVGPEIIAPDKQIMIEPGMLIENNDSNNSEEEWTTVIFKRS